MYLTIQFLIYILNPVKQKATFNEESRLFISTDGMYPSNAGTIARTKYLKL
tara:strand:+ start:155579 stop:155731 length:153 start_codon:yes stop_codon:yes gene_type:complete